ncbi:sensor histidine kinase [Agromyces aerolatus]|uniref:sensor histidine kinase n=1 Tax=Agromyces sp. LY-1074 TaxID=3074080 RepID=UPI00285F5D5C|nr:MULTISPECIES: histidine kinase [unclassified Agromyces]MDR5700164.1 histidine kinase [Agromyces sp. LY-1074]MDR5706468.1 histidine kinase [Agromyces sp. LY-1358]
MEQIAAPGRSDARPAPWVIDLLLGIGVTLTVSMFIAADIQDSEPDGWAYLWAVGLGGLMLVRRRYPVIVVVLSAGAVISYYVAGYPAIGVAVPLAAAAFSAAEFGRMGAAVITCGTVLVISVVYRIAAGQDPAVVLWFDGPGHVLLLAAAIALGDSVRSRRALRRQASEIAALTAERSVREAEQRAIAERLAIARELHDSVGHALTVVTLHAQIAEEALDDDESGQGDVAAALAAIRIIGDTTSSTFEDVRRTVARLRREQGGARPPLRVTDLDAALRPAEQAGLEVRSNVEITSPIPATVEATIYRIVQESVTNVIRHADASRVTVDVTEREGAIDVRIVNDGTSEPSAPGRATPAGSGLAGMRERTTLLGGTFSAERVGRGFVVRASIPLDVPA